MSRMSKLIRASNLQKLHKIAEFLTYSYTFSRKNSSTTGKTVFRSIFFRSFVSSPTYLLIHRCARGFSLSVNQHLILSSITDLLFTDIVVFVPRAGKEFSPSDATCCALWLNHFLSCSLRSLDVSSVA